MTVPLQDNFPTPTYRMGLTAGPLDDLTTITWTSCTTFTHTDGIERLRVLSRRTEAGRSQEFSNVDASRASYVVDDRDRAFDIENASSPFYPHLAPGIVFQELQTWAGFTFTVYTGFIDDITLQWSDVGLRQVVISCLDIFDSLALRELEDSLWKIEVRKDVSANIKAGRNTAWIRLGDPSGSTVVTDYGGQGWNGDYQGEPILGIPSLIAGDTDTAMDGTTAQRASLPHKHLLTGFPFTVEMVIRVFSKPSEAKFLIGAYDVPANFKQLFQLFIIANNDPTNVGKLIATVANPYPLGTESLTTFRVDDGRVHHIAMVMSSPTSLRLWVDGNDVTAVNASNTFVFPGDLATGYAIGNTPAVGFGDFGIDAGSTVDANGIETSGGIQSVVFYDGLALSGTRILDHAAAALFGWGQQSSGSRFNSLLIAMDIPANNRVSETGSSAIQNGMPSGGSVLSYLQLLAASEGGRVFVDPNGRIVFYDRTHPIVNARAATSVATFSDVDGTGTVPGGTIPYVPPVDPHFNKLDLFTRASVTRRGGQPQIYDSIPANDSPRTLTKTDLLMSTDVAARGMAQYLVSVSKTPRPVIHSLTFQPQLAPSIGWPAALGIGQGDRITVLRHPGGGSAVSTDWIVEGITHEDTGAEALWTTTLAVSPADPNHYFKLGSSVLGGSDLLFY